ncbi:MAG: RNA methyltransferase [Prevotella sp.]|nr:RNA methyltransferase [Prevotella sp.]
MTPERITSTQNTKIKHLLLLGQKAGARAEEGLFVVEGRRELTHCLSAGFEVVAVFFCPEILQPFEPLATLIKTKPAYALARNVYERAAYRGGTEGIIAVVRAKKLAFDDLPAANNPLYIAVEGVEKPGNIGAILRTADAANVSAVFVCDTSTDLYNPNVIRSSIGAVFTVPTICCTSAECIAFLKGRGVSILTAQLQDSEPYTRVDMRPATALVVGNEATGLTELWRGNADRHVRIPMCGCLDSLNVSISTAVLVFEAVRQRNLLK